MTDLFLSASATATFVDDGSGNGTTVARCSLGPSVYGVTWQIRRVIISTTCANPGTSQFRMYLSNEMPTYLLDASYNGDQNTSETDIALQTLDKLVCVWVNGDLGATATVILQGRMDDGRG